MAGSFFEQNQPKQFRLVDEDSVIQQSPNYVILREPRNFGEFMLEVQRNEEDRGGTNFEFGEPERTLEISRHNGAYQLCLDIIAARGSDANINIEYWETISGTLTRIFEWEVITSSMDEEDDSVNFRVKRTDYNDKFRTRFGVENDIESDVDLDGGKIAPFDLMNLPMHSKRLQRKSFGNGQPQTINIQAPNATSIVYGEILLGLDLASNSVVNYTNYGNQVQGNNLNGNFYTTGATATDEIFNNTSGQSSNIINNKLAIRPSVGESGDYVLNGRIVIDFTFTNPTPGTENMVVAFYEVIVNEVTGTRTATYLLDDAFSNVNPTVVRNVDFSFNRNITLARNDELYVMGFVRSTGGGSVTQAGTISTQFQGSYLSLTGLTNAFTSQCKGHFIYDVLNRLIQKAVGPTGIGELTLVLSSPTGTFTNGQVVTGATSGATGSLFNQATGDQKGLIAVKGSFRTGETISTATGSGTVNYIIPGTISTPRGKILQSTLLEKTEEGAMTDGCASLNFISNGFAVRNFINEEYDNDRFYNPGDRVRYLEADYVYINATIAKGNLPTNTTFWKAEEGRKVRTSISKLINFVKWRYGAGIAIVKAQGAGFGSSTNDRITRVLIEKQENFFQNKLIVRLSTGVQNPVRRKINKEILFNQLEFGYGIFSEDNEDNSLSGYNTIRNYLTPIQKDESNLRMVPEVCTDGYDIERLRRLSLAEAPEESDENDDETYIIQCLRFNSTNPINSDDFSEETNPATVDRDNGVFTYRDLFLSDQIDNTNTFTHATIGTFTISTITYNRETNTTTITTTDTVPGTGISFLTSYLLHFNVDVFLPQRAQGFSNISNIIDPNSEYNLDHTPTNILIENFQWYGSAFKAKAGTETVKFTSGKNNFLLEKEYDSSTCIPNTDLTSESQDFTLSILRTWSPVLFTDELFEVIVYMDYTVFDRIRKALIGESDEDINYGYVEIPNNQGVFVKSFIVSLEYKPVDFQCKMIVWAMNE